MISSFGLLCPKRAPRRGCRGARNQWRRSGVAPGPPGPAAALTAAPPPPPPRRWCCHLQAELLALEWPEEVLRFQGALRRREARLRMRRELELFDHRHTSLDGSSSAAE